MDYAEYQNRIFSIFYTIRVPKVFLKEGERIRYFNMVFIIRSFFPVNCINRIIFFRNIADIFE